MKAFAGANPPLSTFPRNGRLTRAESSAVLRFGGREATQKTCRGRSTQPSGVDSVLQTGPVGALFGSGSWGPVFPLMWTDLIKSLWRGFTIQIWGAISLNQESKV